MINFGLFVGVGCAIIFYKAAEYERMSPWLWSIASFALSIIINSWMGSIVFVLLSQVALFGVMWWYNAKRPTRTG